ncbi:hypothetical protein MTX78_19040 [Hymenobacter tibetensis]|uniref:Uncharacterized protein n=1 Tax=Hymenobacter tibetensis TaxID=497967 RepID=A0ABY4CYD6_9BACT|nr:hypothetical protein [Hymenobacter tibetensis]UOG74205.1 hypothetical protein MTX78_19040 [Hymenobacter tibetensis]
MEHHAHDNFTPFREVSLFIRGSDAAGNTVIVLADGQLATTCPGEAPLTFITVSTTTRQVQQVKHEFPNGCVPRITQPQIRQLTAAFLRYQAQSLRADSDGNVFVGFEKRGLMAADLVYVNAPAHLDKYFYTDFAPVAGKWYARKASD